MLQNKIKTLTEQLKQVRISQDHLRQQERQIVQAIIEMYEEAGSQQKTPSNEGKPPRRDEGHEPTLKDHKPRSKATGSAKQPTEIPKEEAVIGARVRIKNPKLYTGASTLLESDTKGTVTRKSKFFIFVKTDNPKSTKDIRRSRSNIELLH